MEISERLNILRVLNGFSQEDLSDKSGINRSSLSYYESAKTAPSSNVIDKLVAIYRVPKNYLLNGFPRVYANVWIPKRPQRKQHAKEYDRDIKELLPKFIIENEFDICVRQWLGSGPSKDVIYIFGVRSRIDSILLLDKTNLCGIEVLEGMVSDGHLKQFDLPDLEKSSVSDYSILEIEKNTEILKNFGLICPCVAPLEHSLSLAREATKRNPVFDENILSALFMTCIIICNEYELDVDRSEKVTRLFIDRCKTASSQPLSERSDIKLYLMVNELRELLDKSGIKRRT